MAPNPTLVVKIGSSSLVDDDGRVDADAVARVGRQVVDARDAGARVVLVSSGAIAAGLPELGYDSRPADIETLQAIAAVGQVRLMMEYRACLEPAGVRVGQVLLTRFDFEERSQYLHARSTLRRLLEIGVLPIVNENDTVADDEIRFGENDRLSALVAHLIAADALVLLTDQPGLLSSDPRLSEDATLIDEVHAVDAELEAVAGAGGPLGSGGMASKLAAARMAGWSGVATLIADAARDDVLAALMEGRSVGTVVRPHDRRLSSRKLWIAFAQAAAGRIFVDDGAARALEREGSSLLAVGVVAVSGDFHTGDVVEVCSREGALVAKGLTRVDSKEVAEILGKRDAPVVCHRDDLVVLTGGPGL
ncbi:MAG: glutamate 5-kinase [Acidimicrobiia bacterium]|nr:glutamate 5-kinase [Acidimicrobiia bacterium]